jgi:hypothetical protein
MISFAAPERFHFLCAWTEPWRWVFFKLQIPPQNSSYEKTLLVEGV